MDRRIKEMQISGKFLWLCNYKLQYNLQNQLNIHVNFIPTLIHIITKIFITSHNENSTILNRSIDHQIIYYEMRVQNIY